MSCWSSLWLRSCAKMNSFKICSGAGIQHSPPIQGSPRTRTVSQMKGEHPGDWHGPPHSSDVDIMPDCLTSRYEPRTDIHVRARLLGIPQGGGESAQRCKIHVPALRRSRESWHLQNLGFSLHILHSSRSSVNNICQAGNQHSNLPRTELLASGAAKGSLFNSLRYLRQTKLQRQEVPS